MQRPRESSERSKARQLDLRLPSSTSFKPTPPLIPSPSPHTLPQPSCFFTAVVPSLPTPLFFLTSPPISLYRSPFLHPNPPLSLPSSPRPSLICHNLLYVLTLQIQWSMHIVCATQGTPPSALNILPNKLTLSKHASNSSLLLRTSQAFIHRHTPSARHLTSLLCPPSHTPKLKSLPTSKSYNSFLLSPPPRA